MDLLVSLVCVPCRASYSKNVLEKELGRNLECCLSLKGLSHVIVGTLPLVGMPLRGVVWEGWEVWKRGSEVISM